MSTNMLVVGLGGTVLAITLLLLSWIDMTTGLLPDRLTQPLLWVGLLFNLDGVFVSLQEAVLGATGGYLFLWFMNLLYRTIAGHDGMGYGDFKLTAALRGLGSQCCHGFSWEHASQVGAHT